MPLRISPEAQTKAEAVEEVACMTCFLVQPRTTCAEGTLPTIGWALCQSLKQENGPTDVPAGQ